MRQNFSLVRELACLTRTRRGDGGLAGGVVLLLLRKEGHVSGAERRSMRCGEATVVDMMAG